MAKHRKHWLWFYIRVYLFTYVFLHHFQRGNDYGFKAIILTSRAYFRETVLGAEQEIMLITKTALRRFQRIEIARFGAKAVISLFSLFVCTICLYYRYEWLPRLTVIGKLSAAKECHSTYTYIPAEKRHIEPNKYRSNVDGENIRITLAIFRLLVTSFNCVCACALFLWFLSGFFSVKHFACRFVVIERIDKCQFYNCFWYFFHIFPLSHFLAIAFSTLPFFIFSKYRFFCHYEFAS